MSAPLSPDYRLTIQFSLGGLSFVLFDTSSKKIADIELHQSDNLNNTDELFRTLEKDLNARDLNNNTFQSVTCLIDGRINTLVPETLYQSGNCDQLLNFNFNLPNGFITAADPITSLQVYNLYGYPESLQQRILSKWPNAEVLHSATVFLRSLPQSDAPIVSVNVFAYPNALQAKITAKWPEADIHHSSSVFLESLSMNDNPTVWVNVRNRDFDMAIMKDKLLFFNNFKFQTKVDFSYYLLFAMQQNDLSGLETTVKFSGLIQPSSEIIDLCRRYMKNIQFVTRPSDLNIKESLTEVPFQYYYNHYQILK